ncbi:zinc knuckle CX2CX4HX4C containing protein [Tanacetum coccineum]
MFNVDDLRAVKPNREKLLRDVTERINKLTGKGGVAVSHQRMLIRVLNNPNSTIHKSYMERDDSKSFIEMVLNQRSQTDGHKDANDNHYANLDINVSRIQNVSNGCFRTGSSLGNRDIRRPDGTQTNSQSTVLEYPNAKPIVNESGNTSDFIPNSLQSVRGSKVQTYNIDDVAKLFSVSLNTLKDIDDFVQDLQLGKHEIWPLLSKEKGQEITYIVCNRYVILSESASMPNATRVNLVESGVTCDGSLKVCNSSPLVSPSTTINIPRRLFSIDVAATFGVPLSTVGDLHKLINDIEVGKHDELLSGMTNDDRMETMDALGTICNSIQADNNNADVIPCKVSHVDDSINLNVDESTIPSDPIIQSVDINTKSTSYVGAAGASIKDQPKVNSNFRTLVADPVFDGVNISIPQKFVKKAKHGLKRIMMNSKRFFFFKIDSWAGLEAVLDGGPWLIRKSLIILKKWSMDTRLLKEELTRIPIWVKLHDVPIQVFEEDRISLIATFIGKPVMLDSYTSSMCNDSWGRSSFARCLIEVNSEADLVDVVTIGIPSLSGDGFTKETIHVEYEWRPPRCDICKIFGHVHDHCPNKVVSPPIATTSNVVTPTVEKTNDGFQTVGKKKKRKGKSKSTNGG